MAIFSAPSYMDMALIFPHTWIYLSCILIHSLSLINLATSLSLPIILPHTYPSLKCILMQSSCTHELGYTLILSHYNSSYDPVYHSLLHDYLLSHILIKPSSTTTLILPPYKATVLSWPSHAHGHSLMAVIRHSITIQFFFPPFPTC